MWRDTLRKCYMISYVFSLLDFFVVRQWTLKLRVNGVNIFVPFLFMHDIPCVPYSTTRRNSQSVWILVVCPNTVIELSSISNLWELLEDATGCRNVTHRIPSLPYWKHCKRLVSFNCKFCIFSNLFVFDIRIFLKFRKYETS